MARASVTPNVAAAAGNDAAVRLGTLARIRERPAWLAVAGLTALFGALVAGISLGTVAVDPADTVAILAHRLLGWSGQEAWAATAETIVFDLRLPRVLTAMVVGLGLADGAQERVL